MTAKEKLLKKVGTFGWFQKRLVGTAIFSSMFSASMIVACGVFVVYTPPHRCYIPEIDDDANLTYLHNNLPEIHVGRSNDSNSDDFDLLSRYIPIETELDGAKRWSKCYRYLDNDTDLESNRNRTQIKCQHGWRYMVERGVLSATMQIALLGDDYHSLDDFLRKHALSTFSSTGRFNEYFKHKKLESTISNLGTVPVTCQKDQDVQDFDLVCDRAWMAPLAPTLQLCGFLEGNIGGGYISDRYGRRFSLLLSWTIFVTSATVISVLPIWEITYVFWLIMGMGGTSRSSTNSVIINEWTPVKYRYLAGCMNLAVCAMCYMLLPLLNYWIVNYRHFLAVYAAIQFFILILIFRNVKESLSWLLQHSKHDQALKMLKEIAKVNKKTLKKNDEEYLIDNIEHTKDDGDEKNQYQQKTRMSYLDMLRIPFLRKRLWILSLAWTATVLNYHALSINTNSLGGNRYIACFLSAVMEIPGHVLSFFGLKKIGGRTSYMIMIALCGTCLLLTLPFIHVNQTAVVVCNMTGKLFASGTAAIVYVFAGDFFPTLLRNQSYGASNLPARIVAMCAPFLLYLGEQVSEAIPYVVMGFFSMIAATAVFFLPEIKGTPLPETLEDARNQEKLVKTCRIGQLKGKDENANLDSRMDLS